MIDSLNTYFDGLTMINSRLPPIQSSEKSKRSPENINKKGDKILSAIVWPSYKKTHELSLRIRIDVV